MAELHELMDRIDSGLKNLSEAQVRYDAVGWQISSPPSAKLRHITLHLSISVGRLSEICERQEHLERSTSATGVEVCSQLAERSSEIAHLLTSAVQLANLAGVDLGDLIRGNFLANAKRFAPDSEFAQL